MTIATAKSGATNNSPTFIAENVIEKFRTKKSRVIEFLAELVGGSGEFSRDHIDTDLSNDSFRF